MRSESGQKVSEGTQVWFLDYLEDGSPAEGKFRIINGVSNVDSKVNAIYSPGLVTANQNITIEVRVLNVDGETTSVTDTKEIYINSD